MFLYSNAFLDKKGTKKLNLWQGRGGERERERAPMERERERENVSRERERETQREREYSTKLRGKETDGQCKRKCEIE